MKEKKFPPRVTGDAVLYGRLLNLTRKIAKECDVRYASFSGESIRVDFEGGKSVVFDITVLE